MVQLDTEKFGMARKKKKVHSGKGQEMINGKGSKGFKL